MPCLLALPRPSLLSPLSVGSAAGMPDVEGPIAGLEELEVFRNRVWGGGGWGERNLTVTCEEVLRLLQSAATYGMSVVEAVCERAPRG